MEHEDLDESLDKINMLDTEYKILDLHTNLNKGHVQVPSDVAEILEIEVHEASELMKNLEQQGFLFVEEEIDEELGYNITAKGIKYVAYRKASHVK